VAINGVWPITVAARSKPLNIFTRSNAGIVGSNPNQGKDFCLVCVYSVFVLFCMKVEAFRRANLPSNESYLPCKTSRNLKSGQCPTKGCRVIIIITQFNSIRVYLRANLTAQRQITKLVRVHRNTEIIKKQNTNKTVYNNNNNNNNNNYNNNNKDGKHHQLLCDDEFYFGYKSEISR
jgi:hypothetical protein